jgi:hypothetical protein
VIYLEDNDIVHMKGGEYTVFNWSDVDSPSVEVRRTIQTLTMEVSQIMKVRGQGGAELGKFREGRSVWADQECGGRAVAKESTGRRALPSSFLLTMPGSPSLP